MNPLYDDQELSDRLGRFMFFRCRTVGTGGQFIGPEWVRVALERITGRDRHCFDCPTCGKYVAVGEDQCCGMCGADCTVCKEKS